MIVRYIGVHLIITIIITIIIIIIIIVNSGQNGLRALNAGIPRTPESRLRRLVNSVNMQTRHVDEITTLIGLKLY